MTRNQLLRLGGISIMLIVIFISSCKKEDLQNNAAPGFRSDAAANNPASGFNDNNMVMYWNDKTNLVLSVGMPQPNRSRLFAIIEIAVHDALNSIRPKYERYALTNAREQFASPDAAVASAAYWAIKGLNLQGSFAVDEWYNSSMNSIPDGGGKELGTALGKLAAETIISRRANDGISQVQAASPFPANGTTPGAYRQTNTPDLRFVPNWGTVMQPWVTSSNYQFRPEGPYAVTSAAYATDYNEVKQKGARENSTRTAAETELAAFWSDNRPSFIWNNVARAAIADKKLDAWKTARYFAIIHTAIADGFNTALEASYYFYFWRPETAIRLGDDDGNPATDGDGTWLPSLNEGGPWVSPPVPEYPSGHAVPGGVVAEVAKNMFGSDAISFQISSTNLPGVTLSYSSVADAARDNSLGKIYAGWNFRKSALDGEGLGNQIAAYVLSHAFQPAD